MRTTLALDDELIAKAEALTGLTEKSRLVREALKALIERESSRRLQRAGPQSCAAAADVGVILVDTSVWVDHLRGGDQKLAELLDLGLVLVHPFVVGEIALGRLRQRDIILEALLQLPRTVVATDGEILAFISRQRLFGQGTGYVDVHLLAAVRLTTGAKLWSRDRCLAETALALGVAFDASESASS